MEKDWLFKGDGYICDLRAVGVLMQGDRILVQRDREGTDYALPGGHVKIGETTEEALVRELKEETGVDIQCRRLLWTEECFWNWNGTDAHNIAFYYLVEPRENAALPMWDGFVPHRDNDNVLIGWMPIKEMQNATIYPAFLKEEVFHLDGPIKHFVSKG